MRRLLYLLLFVSQIAWAELPLSFTSTPTVNNMAIGQIQTLNYTIHNYLKNQALPINNIRVLNDGDNQPDSLISTSSSCSSVLPAQSSCTITVTIDHPQTGKINRHLSIEYNGRAPLTSPISLTIAQAKYTILVYIVGSDLESDSSAATDNINQMKQVGSTSNMNVVIETGGANKTGWQTVQRKLILHNDEQVLQDLGSLNMGLTSTIENFFEWGIQQYPADKYIAIFWDHGGGPNGGFGSDEIHGNAGTPINQLAAAMRSVTQATGKHFEIIGFDACLMGNIETISGLYPYTNYVIGSEDLEPGEGWQYNTFLNYVNNHPTANGVAVGTVIIDGYTEQNNDDSTTLSIVDSLEVPNLLSAINQFTSTLSPYVNSSVANWKQVARGRARTPDYATSVWDNQDTDLADLLGLANGIAVAFPGDQALQNAASSLSTATQQAVKYYKNSPNRSASFGLTIYFPSILAAYQHDYPTVTQLDGSSFFSQNYINLVENYHQFYTNELNNLIAIPDNLAFDGTHYIATVSNDFEDLYAAVGKDDCTNVVGHNGSPLGPVPCYTGLQYSDIQRTPGGGNTWNISYDKAAHSTNWPLLNGKPVLLIGLDTEPVIHNEISFMIPVTMSPDNDNGYLVILRDEHDTYHVVGFQEDTGSTNPETKTVDILDGTQFYIRTYAFNGGWSLFRTTEEVTAPFTITFGTVPSSDFNSFRFLVADLTGTLHITNTSEPY